MSPFQKYHPDEFPSGAIQLSTNQVEQLDTPTFPEKSSPAIQFIPTSQPELPDQTPENIDNQNTPFSLLAEPEINRDQKTGLISEIKVDYHNSDNRLESKILTPKEAGAFLHQLKVEDLSLHQNNIPTNSYQLRRTLFILAGQTPQTQFDSWHAFTWPQTFALDDQGNIFRDKRGKIILPGKFSHNLDQALADESIWLPARQKLHAQIIGEQLINIKQLAEQLKLFQKINNLPDKTTIYLLRGNSGSGKSSGIKEYFANTDTPINLTGFINPDSYKYLLKNDFLIDGKYPIHQDLIHFEGAHLAYRLNNHPEAKNISKVYDRRHLNISDDDLELLRNQCDRLVILSTDAPAILCALRSLPRDPHQPSPPVSSTTIINGHQTIRAHTLPILLNCQKKDNDWVDFVLITNHSQDGIKQIFTKDQLRIFTENETTNEADENGQPKTVRVPKFIDLARLWGQPITNREEEDRMIIRAKHLPLALHPDTEAEIQEVKSIICNEVLKKLSQNKQINHVIDQNNNQKLCLVLDNNAQTSDLEGLTDDDYRNIISKLISCSSLINSSFNRETRKIFINKVFDCILTHRDSKITDHQYITHIINNIYFTTTGKSLSNSATNNDFFQKLFDKFQESGVSPRQLAAYIEYYIGQQNVFQIDHSEIFGKLIASWIMIRNDHHSLPTKFIPFTNSTESYNNYQAEYIEKAFSI